MTCKNFANRAIAILLSVVMLVGMIPAVGISADDPAPVIVDLTTIKFKLVTQFNAAAPEGALEWTAATAEKPVLTLRALDSTLVSGGEFRYSQLVTTTNTGHYYSMAGNHIIKLYYKAYDSSATPKTFTYKDTSNPARKFYPIYKTFFSGNAAVAMQNAAATGEDNGWQYIIVDFSAENGNGQTVPSKETIQGLQLKQFDLNPFGYTVPARSELTFPLNFEVGRLGFFSSMEAALADSMPVAEEPTEYTVTYKANGEVVYTQTVEEGEALAYPAELTTPTAPEGFEFDGWSVAEGTAVNSDIEVVAQWKEIVAAPTEYTVTYKANGEVVYTQTVEEGEALAYPAELTTPTAPEGYEFDGWSVVEGTIVESDIEVVAQFKAVTPAPEPTEYTVTYKANGEVVYTQTVEEGEALAYPAELTTPTAPEGFEFDGWSVAEGTAVNSDIEVVAKWKEVIVEGPVIIDAINLPAPTLADQYNVSAGPELEYTAPTAENPVMKFTAVDASKFTGEYRKTMLNVNKPMAGNHILKVYYKGYDSSATPKSYIYGSVSGVSCFPVYKIFFKDSTAFDVAKLNTTKTGEDVNGWNYVIYDFSNAAADKFARIPDATLVKLDLCQFYATKPSRSELTFPLNFEVGRVAMFPSIDEALADHMPLPKYTVTYYDVNGEEYNKQFVTVGEAPVTPAAPAAPADNQFFIGWYDAAEGGNLVADGTTVSGDMNLYARYQVGNKIVFTVDGEEVATKYVSPKAAVLAAEDYPADPTNETEGMYFAGWATTVDGNDFVKAGETAFNAAETVLYAQFRESVTVTYAFPEGDVEYIHALGAYLKHEEFDAEPVKDGMVFMGWALENAPTDIVEDGAFTVTEAITFVPVFKYAVTFDYTSPADAEAEELITLYFLEGEALVFPEAPAKDGAYDFDRWVDANGDDAVEGTDVTEAAAYTAEFVVSADPIEVIYMVEADSEFIFKKIIVPGNEILLGENGYLSTKELADEINAGPYNEFAFDKWSYTDAGNFINNGTALDTTPLALNAKDVNKPVVVVPVFTSDATTSDPVYYVVFKVDGEKYASATSKAGTIVNLAEIEAIARAAEEREFLHFVDKAGRKIDENTVLTENMVLTPKYSPIVLNPVDKDLGSIVGIIAVMKKIKEHNGQPTSAIGSRPYRLYDGDELINTTVTSQYAIKFEDGYVRFAVNADTPMLDQTLIDVTFPQNDLVKVKEAPVIVVGYRTNADKLAVFNGAINLLNENMATTRMWGGEINPSKINSSEQWTTAIMNLKGRTFTGGSGSIVKDRTIEQFNAVVQESYHSGWDMRLADKNIIASAGTYLDIRYVALFESLEEAGNFVYQPGILDKGEFEAKKAADKKAAEEAKKAAEEAKKAAEEAAKATEEVEAAE